MVNGFDIKDRQNLNVPEGRVFVPRERNHNSAPFVVCSSEEIPLKIKTGNRHLDLNNTVILQRSKDAIVPSGAGLRLNSKKYHVSYGQAILEIQTTL